MRKFKVEFFVATMHEGGQEVFATETRADNRESLAESIGLKKWFYINEKNRLTAINMSHVTDFHITEID